jgi:hypothetical protein
MRGSLDEFTLAEVLQLFSITEKSGVLYVEARGQRSNFYIEGGRLVGWGGEDGAVINELVCHEALLAPAIPPHRSTPNPEPASGASLIARNSVEPFRWNLVVRRILERHVYPCLDATDGELELRIQPPPAAPIHLSVGIQELILDGSRAEADRVLMAKQGYSANSRWQRVTLGDAGSSPSLDRLDWLVWVALREPCSIAEAAARIQAPELDVGHAVHRLHRLGLLDAVEALQGIQEAYR